MRRALPILVAVTVATGLLLGPAAGTSHSADSGTTCVWKKHTKRIVRHVKRHGRRRRIVRIKHRWTCVPQAAPTPTPAPNPTPDPPVAPPVTPPTDPDPVGPSRLGVESTEYSYTFSRPSVKAGDFIVELNNSGDDPHNLNIAASDGDGGRTGPDLASIPTVDPGGQATTRFDIAPGEYYLYCSLPRHEGRGMHATLEVTP